MWESKKLIIGHFLSIIYWLLNTRTLGLLDLRILKNHKVNKLKLYLFTNVKIGQIHFDGSWWHVFSCCPCDETFAYRIDKQRLALYCTHSVDAAWDCQAAYTDGHIHTYELVYSLQHQSTLNQMYALGLPLLLHKYSPV